MYVQGFFDNDSHFRSKCIRQRYLVSICKVTKYQNRLKAFNNKKATLLASSFFEHLHY